MDGHCGFHTISYLVTGSAKHHGLFRKMIARHILANTSANFCILENGKDVALADLQVEDDKSTNVWMRSIHLAAAADLLQVNLLVKRPERHGGTLYNTTTFYNDMERGTTYLHSFPSMLLNNQSSDHFEPILTLKKIEDC